MDASLLWIPAALAALNWAAVARGWKPLEYFAKPGTMVALLVWMAGVPGDMPWGVWAWFAAGIGLSMLGDIFLMAPRDLFLPGLIAFLLAHLAYVIGFNPTPFPLNAVSVVLILLVGATAGRVFRGLLAGLSARGLMRLQRPVLVYTGGIALMVISALLTVTRPEWARLPALIAALGGILFMVSDTVLAWDRFVTPVPRGRLIVMVTYHLAQFGIVLGVGLHLFG